MLGVQPKSRRNEMNTPSILSRIADAARRQAHRETLHRQQLDRHLEQYTPADVTLAKDARHAREMTRQQFNVWG
jgi:hypothetical protein